MDINKHYHAQAARTDALKYQDDGLNPARVNVLKLIQKAATSGLFDLYMDNIYLDLEDKEFFEDLGYHIKADGGNYYISW